MNELTPGSTTGGSRYFTVAGSRRGGVFMGQSISASNWRTGGVPAPPVFTYTVSNNQATVTGLTGTMPSNLTIPETLGGFPVVAIGNNAFQNRTAIVHVNMPDSITTIQLRAFRGCVNLSSIRLSRNLTVLQRGAFRDCTNLTEIEIPRSLTNVDASDVGSNSLANTVFRDSGLKTVTFEQGITQIPNYLFAHAYNLETITISDTVTRIGNNAFRSATNLKTVNFSQNLVTIESGAFQNCRLLESIILPDSVVTIQSNAFRDCVNLSSIRLSRNLTTLQRGAFRDCTNLTEIEIPRSLTNVDASDVGSNSLANTVFRDSGLKTVTFEQGITQIPNYLFAHAYNLENITIHDTVTRIGNSAFRNCSSLTEIHIPNRVTDMGTYVFANATSLERVTLPNTQANITNGTFLNCTSLKEITLPPTVTAIRREAFRGTSALSSLILPDNVQTIEADAFRNSGISEIILPNGLLTIGDDAFRDTRSLKEIVIPSSVTSVGARAFQDTHSVETATVNAVGTIGADTFLNNMALHTLVFGDKVRSIAANVARGHTSGSALKNLTLGQNIRTIPDSAFRLNPELVDVVIPRFVTSIAANAFAENTGLRNAYIPPSVTSIPDNAFSYVAWTTIHGASGSFAETYANRRGMTFVPINAPITAMSFRETEITIGRNQTAIFIPLDITPAFDTDTITFTSSDTNIVSFPTSGTGAAEGRFRTHNRVGTATMTATNSDGTVIATATIHVTDATAPTFTTHPTSPPNQSTSTGQSVTFTVAVVGNPAPQLQWQVSTDGGTTWTDIDSETSTELTITNISLDMNNNMYRAIATNEQGTVQSNPVTLTVADTIDTSELQTNITYALSLLDDTRISADGTDVPRGEYWVTQDAHNALQDAINAALNVLNSID